MHLPETDVQRSAVRSLIRSPAGRGQRAVSRMGTTPDLLLRLLPLLAILAALAAWEVSVRVGAVSPLFYPPPSAIAETIGRLAREGALTANLGTSLTRILLGFACGGGIGLLLGLCMGWSRRVRLVLDPLVATAHPVPRLALLPLILLIFGIGETSRILVISISCFFPMLINAMAGVREIEPLYFDVARGFGARSHQVLAHVVLPGSLPSVLAGARLSLISALKTTLGIELITSEEGLGYLIWFAWETFRTQELYATLVVIAGLGIAMSFGLGGLRSRLVPERKEGSR